MLPALSAMNPLSSSLLTGAPPRPSVRGQEGRWRNPSRVPMSLRCLPAAGRWLGPVCGVFLLTGCAGQFQHAFLAASPQYRPENIYQGGESLPLSMKRVAVLPLVVTAPGPQAEGATASLEPLVLTELGKAGRFEVLPLSAASVEEWTGRRAWTTADELPEGFFDRVRQGTGADGVLFLQVTQFRAYPPLAVGWRLQLVDLDGPRVWWAVDEVFDASELKVANSARRYYLDHAGKPLELTDAGEILYSPRRFGAYTASAVVASCPPRGAKKSR